MLKSVMSTPQPQARFCSLCEVLYALVDVKPLSTCTVIPVSRINAGFHYGWSGPLVLLARELAYPYICRWPGVGSSKEG